MINTVTGTITPDELGITLAHEHVTLEQTSRYPEDHFLHPYTLPPADEMIPEVQRFADVGGRTLVSQTNQTMGRDVAALKTISEATGVQIIAATGYYTRESTPHIDDPRAVADFFVSEITEGIEGTGIKAGVIGEIGTCHETPGLFERTLFDASARASMETGVPIATHTHGGVFARWQLKYLLGLGLPASRILIGHMDETLAVRDNRPTDLELALEIVDSGAYVSVDSVGMSYYGEWLSRPEPSDHDRAWLIAQLVDRGYKDQILLGHDVACADDLHANGGPGYAHIVNSFIDKLSQFGVSNEIAQRLLVDNPRRWFAVEV